MADQASRHSPLLPRRASIHRASTARRYERPAQPLRIDILQAGVRRNCTARAPRQPAYHIWRYYKQDADAFQYHSFALLYITTCLDGAGSPRLRCDSTFPATWVAGRNTILRTFHCATMYACRQLSAAFVQPPGGRSATYRSLRALTYLQLLPAYPTTFTTAPSARGRRTTPLRILARRGSSHCTHHYHARRHTCLAELSGGF